MGRKKLILLLWGVVIAVWVFIIALPDQGPTAEDKAATEAALAECRKDLQCWADSNHIEASSACLTAIDRMFGAAAKWDDGTALKVRYHRWLDRDAATLTYYGEALSVPNGSGDLVRQRFECDYDPAKGEMTAFRVDAVIR